jgi:hypothetical protein
MLLLLLLLLLLLITLFRNCSARKREPPGESRTFHADRGGRLSTVISGFLWLPLCARPATPSLPRWQLW